jgi:peroxiredoxin
MTQFPRWPVVSVVLAIGTAMILSVTYGAPPPPPPAATMSAANLDFVLKDMNGQTVRLADFKGRPVIMNFWATWCGPCRSEMPEFMEIAEQFKDRRLVMLGVSVDDQPEAIRKFADELHLNYPQLVGLGEDKLQEAYDAVVAVPVTWFIRADGSVQAVQKGPATRDWFQAQARALVATAAGDRP